jgi:hypothetical protein
VYCEPRVSTFSQGADPFLDYEQEEAVSAQVYTVSVRFMGLPCWRPARWCWSRVYSWLAGKLDDRPGALGWLWRLTHVREWQKSSLINATTWVLCTLVIYKLVERLGHGWKVNTAMSLIVDSVMFVVNKLWVWKKRKVTVAASGSRNFVTWLFFFALNGLFAWLLMNRAGMNTMAARGVLGCYGFLMNPALFVLKDRMVFGQQELKEVLPAVWRVLRKSGTA